MDAERGSPVTKTHLVEFTDGSAKASGARHDGISLSCSGDEILRRFEVDGVPYFYGNSAGLVRLGEILIQIGLSEYKDGYHLNIREDFDGDKEEIVILGVKNSD
jgi:hypothetical protein